MIERERKQNLPVVSLQAGLVHP